MAAGVNQSVTCRPLVRSCSERRRATPSRRRRRARRPAATTGTATAAPPGGRCLIRVEDAPTACVASVERFAALARRRCSPRPSGVSSADLDDGERAERSARVRTNSWRSADERRAIDRIGPQLVVVGDRERRQARGFEQIAFDGSLEDADFEDMPRCRSRRRAERDEQRQPQSQRQRPPHFRPGGAPLRRLGDVGSGVIRAEVIADWCFGSFYRSPRARGTGIVFRIVPGAIVVAPAGSPG